MRGLNPVMEGGDAFFPPFEDKFEPAEEIRDVPEFKILHYRHKLMLNSPVGIFQLSDFVRTMEYSRSARHLVLLNQIAITPRTAQLDVNASRRIHACGVNLRQFFEISILDGNSQVCFDKLKMTAAAVKSDHAHGGA